MKVADGKFELWKKDPFHPSLHFKCVNSEDKFGLSGSWS